MKNNLNELVREKNINNVYHHVLWNESVTKRTFSSSIKGVTSFEDYISHINKNIGTRVINYDR